eukprot:scaffold24661_cov71-Skeletonema_dohrnii-CCMP3373.AAC.1
MKRRNNSMNTPNQINLHKTFTPIEYACVIKETTLQWDCNALQAFTMEKKTMNKASLSSSSSSYLGSCCEEKRSHLHQRRTWLIIVQR